MFERKDAKVQRRKECPEEEAFKKYPGTVPAFWVRCEGTAEQPDLYGRSTTLQKGFLCDFAPLRLCV